MSSDDEIDLRPYIQTILQRWWQIVLIGVLVAAIGLLYSISQHHVYRTAATILLTRSRTKLSLSDQYQTVTEPFDSRSRLDALLTIVQTDDVAAKVFSALKDEEGLKDYDLASFKTLVEITNEGDALIISASNIDPLLAAKIANEWAKISVSTINQAYSDEQPLADLQQQITAASKDYENAQAAYETFVKTNQIELLNTQIAEAQNLETSLSTQRSWRISYYTQRIQDMEDLEVKAEALKNQLQSGNQSSAGNFGDAISVLLARATGFTSSTPVELQPVDPTIKDVSTPPAKESPGLTLQLQFNDPTPLQDSTENYVADLTSMIQLAQKESTKAEEALKTLTKQVLQNVTDEQLALAAAQVRELQTQLEDQESKQEQLKSQRDLSWEAYQALVQKETELRNAAQSGTQVNLASIAVPPDKPVSRGTFRNTAAGFILGIVLSSLFFIVVEWWQSAKQPPREALAHANDEATS